MTWFFIALGAPALWAASNLIDKHLLEAHAKDRGPGAFYIFGGFASLILLALILALRPDVLHIPLRHALLLALGGVCGAGMLYCYLRAMQQGEASVVVSFFQLIPVFYLVLGYLVLHEALSRQQLLGAAVMVVAALGLCFDMAEEGVRFRWPVLGWMSLACLVAALDGLAYKYVGVRDGYAAGLFWDYAGHTLVVLTVFLVSAATRREFLGLFRVGPRFVGLLGFNEAITLAGNLLMSRAQLLVPLALAQVVNGFQPVFILAFSAVLAAAVPRLNYEKLLRRHITQKVAAILAILVGTWLVGA